MAEPAEANSAKRVRAESDESPEAKRLRAADLILRDILEDVDTADRGLAAAADGDLDSVLRSFEEEIAAAAAAAVTVSPQAWQTQQRSEDGILGPTCGSDESDEPRRTDLVYLLEASDDDLGLPPTAPSSDDGEAPDGDPGREEVQELPVALGQMWEELDDEVRGYYDALGFGGGYGRDAAGAFDGAVYGYPEGAFDGAADLSDVAWRPESLPAL